MKCLQREGSNSPSPIITLMIGSLGGLIFGYDTGIMALAGIHVQREFNVPDSDNVTKGFITSIVLFGAMLGSFACGIMATKLGRRLTAFISAGICLFGGVTAAFSVDLASFMILRFILGIGIGIVGVVCPMYVSETAPREYTGTYGVIFQLMLTLGILLSYIVGFGLNRISDPHLAWRIMLGSGGGLFAIALMFVVFFGAVETYKGSMIASQHLVAGYEKKKRGGAFDLISLEKLPQTISGVVLAVTLQLTGINAIMYYGPIIIKESGFDNEDALNIGIGVWNFLTTFIAAFLVDRVGRRLLMVGGTAVMSLALIAVAICLSPFVPDGTGKGYGVAIGLAFLLADLRVVQDVCSGYWRTRYLMKTLEKRGHPCQTSYNGVSTWLCRPSFR